jgi:tetratricopeptide (TPR) repeat protein
MSRITKKYLFFLIGFFILFSFTCYSEAISTTQQKQAEEWFKKALDTEDLRLKIEYYNKAIELNPKHAGAFNNRGLVYIRMGDFQKAIDDFSKAI